MKDSVQHFLKIFLYVLILIIGMTFISIYKYNQVPSWLFKVINFLEFIL